jgi:pimeloyl-ACP methyl ester carboxylesterase
MTPLTSAGCAVLVPDMRGYGDSDKPRGDHGYDGRALAEAFRALVRAIRFGSGRLTLVAHDMGAPAALLGAVIDDYTRTARRPQSDRRHRRRALTRRPGA